jgi:glucokinase
VSSVLPQMAVDGPAVCTVRSVTTVLAVDVGGTKLAVARVSATGAVSARHTAPTPTTTDAERVWGTLAALISAALEDGPVDACGCGCGGPMTPGGAEVSPLNIPAWRGFPLRRRLQAAVGAPAYVDNDAKALALGEGWLGEARGASDFLAMVVSTGVGGGIVLDGRLLDGRLGNAGHIGHVIVWPDGPQCVCGARGCLEAVASGPAIARRTGAPAADAPAEVRVEAGMYVGRAIASVANLLDLPLAVIAGSVALGYGDDFFRAAQASVDASCRLDFSLGTRVRPAGLGADGPIVGAAAVALQHHVPT